MLGTELYDCLNTDQQTWFERSGGAYRLDCTSIEDIEDTVRGAGFGWSVQSSVNKFREGKASLPLDDISVEDVREKIDIARLGPTRAKTCPAATLFADIDGYTSLVDSLAGDTDELTRAVQLLHLFRYELRQVTERDFDGIALQHQGDRLQALLHSPRHDDGDVMQDAVNLCIAYNSSVEEVVNRYHDFLGKLHIGIGCAFGRALVGMLGTKGDRDPVCIGNATVTAEAIQLAVPGNRMGITKEMHEAIEDEDVADQFTWSQTTNCYTADGITWVTIEEAADGKAYRTAKDASYAVTGAILVGVRRSPELLPLRVTRPYAE